MTALGTLTPTNDGNVGDYPFAINSSGMIVGKASTVDDFGNLASGSHAVYWTEAGQAIDLNSLIDPARAGRSQSHMP